MRSITLKRKILLGYGVIFALMSLVVACAVANLVSLGRAADQILRENYRSILAAENMVDTLERQDSGILLMFLGEAEKGAAQFHENEAVFLQWLARAEDNITIEGEKELIQSIKADYADYRELFSTLSGLRGEVDPAAILTSGYYQETVFPVFARVRKACVDLRILNEETMYAASVRAGGVAERAIWSTALVAGVGLVVALVFSLLLAERISGPVRRFIEALQKVSTGDYAVEVPVEAGDELGRLAGELNYMAVQVARYHEMDIEQVLEAERLKSEFVTAASHQLRSPLTSLGMSIDLLIEHASQALGEKDLRLLEAAQEEVQRLKALVSDLLDLSKIEAGRIDLEFECVKVQVLFERVREVFRSQLRVKDVQLTTDVADGLPAVRADANKITWVLTNLVSNALRYVSKGGHITLGANRAGEFVQLSVRDDGPGIPPGYHARIFEKFVQVEGRETGGAGLGLAICKEIVRAHGGTIRVESPAGRGSTFVFTLPAVRRSYE